jgi:hypothetical protein
MVKTDAIVPAAAEFGIAGPAQGQIRRRAGWGGLMLASLRLSGAPTFDADRTGEVSLTVSPLDTSMPRLAHFRSARIDMLVMWAIS